MQIAALAQQIERMGGRFQIDGCKVAILWPESTNRILRREYIRLDKAARKLAYGLTAWILEREASEPGNEAGGIRSGGTAMRAVRRS